MDAAFIVMGYLVKTKHFGITFGGKLRPPYGLTEMPPGYFESRGLWIAHDASWGGEPKPMAGHVVMWLNGPLIWHSNLLRVIAQSTCEAETSEASRAAKTGMFCRNLLAYYGIKLGGATPLFGDNRAMFDLLNHEGASVRTRYFERATLFVKRAVQLLVFVPHLVRTSDCVADIFTKATDKATFVKFRNVIMNNQSSLKSVLEHSLLGLHGASKRMAEHLLAKLF